MLQSNIILLRGLPGAGKSSLATLLSENGTYPIFSVDDYFTDENGNYEFNFTDNYLAYEQCRKGVEDAIKNKAAKIIVHNTFTLTWELEPYFLMAKTHNCLLYVLTVENYHTCKNKHGVSDEQLQKMAEKYTVKLV